MRAGLVPGRLCTVSPTLMGMRDVSDREHLGRTAVAVDRGHFYLLRHRIFLDGGLLTLIDSSLARHPRPLVRLGPEEKAKLLCATAHRLGSQTT